MTLLVQTNREIASFFFIRDREVASYLDNIYQQINKSYLMDDRTKISGESRDQ